jgi:hypothetical protein
MSLSRSFRRGVTTKEFDIIHVEPWLLSEYTHLYNFFVMRQDLRPKATWWFGLKPRGFFQRPHEDIIVVDYDASQTDIDSIVRELADAGIDVVPRQ